MSFISFLRQGMITHCLPMLLKDRRCRIVVYELTKSKFIQDIIVIRALKYTRSDPGLQNKSNRFQVVFHGVVQVPLEQAIHHCCHI